MEAPAIDQTFDPAPDEPERTLHAPPQQPQQTGDLQQQTKSSSLSDDQLDAGQEENSSDEDWGISKRGRKAAEPPPKLPRVENDTTAKLRSSAPEEQPRSADHGSDEDSCMEEGSDGEGRQLLCYFQWLCCLRTSAWAVEPYCRP
jgi:hypothetical protein